MFFSLHVADIDSEHIPQSIRALSQNKGSNCKELQLIVIQLWINKLAQDKIIFFSLKSSMGSKKNQKQKHTFNHDLLVFAKSAPDILLILQKRSMSLSL